MQSDKTSERVQAESQTGKIHSLIIKMLIVGARLAGLNFFLC